MKYIIAIGLALVAVVGSCAWQDDASHSGPTIRAEVLRGALRLPIYKVDHLRSGDKLLVSTDRVGTIQGSWIVVLAVASPSGNKVTTRQFDLAADDTEPAIDITADDQVPIMVIAPQVTTLFGLRTSFDQSANLITDAITSDPQRFVELQKIDQINHTIASISSGLDAVVVKLKPEQATESAKVLAAKFGVKNVDAECFKGAVVDTRCVAASIVANRELKIPTVSELGSMAQPFASTTLPPDLLANVRLVAAASTFLSNKYRDQYDFAPSSVQRDKDQDKLQLFTTARFRSGNVKTAYVYVPSWNADIPPQLAIANKKTICLTSGEIGLQVKGPMPLTNYWHSWDLELVSQDGSVAPLHTDEMTFVPEKGLLSVNVNKIAEVLASFGTAAQARLSGRYGFERFVLEPFAVSLPAQGDLQKQLIGLDNLVAGDKATLWFTDGGDCVDHVAIVSGGRAEVAAGVPGTRGVEINLKNVPAGPATLTVAQFGMVQQSIPVQIMQPRARIDKAEHFDLEAEIRVYGENLDRVDAIMAGEIVCTPNVEEIPIPSQQMRRFACPQGMTDNGQYTSQVTITYLQNNPPPQDFALSKLGARPHMRVGGGKFALVPTLSPKAVQWGLGLTDALFTEDSGVSLLLQAQHGYRLQRGTYFLQLRLDEDPITEQAPITVSLMADSRHNELRTRAPVSFHGVQLPNIINPVWYRVLHHPSGLTNEWQTLNRAVVSLPSFGAVTCEASSKRLLIHGKQLDYIDWASNNVTTTSHDATPLENTLAEMIRCENGLCLGIEKLGDGGHLKTKVHWIDDRVFDVTFPSVPECQNG